MRIEVRVQVMRGRPRASRHEAINTREEASTYTLRGILRVSVTDSFTQHTWWGMIVNVMPNSAYVFVSFPSVQISSTASKRSVIGLLPHSLSFGLPPIS